MSKKGEPQKLRPFKPDEVIRAFKHAGFCVRGETEGTHKSRTAGSHVVMEDPQTGKLITITKKQNHDVSPNLLRKILRDAGLTETEFLGYLARKGAPPPIPLMIVLRSALSE